MARAKTVSNYFARQALGRVQHRSMDEAEFLARTGLSRAELETAGGRIAWSRHVKVVEASVLLELAAPLPDASGDRFWERMQGDFPILVSAWLNAPTARDALTRYLAYRPILGESDFLRVRETEDVIRLEYVAEGPQRLAGWQARGNFLSILSILRTYPAAAGLHGRIRVMGSSTSYARVGLDIADISWDSDVNALEIPRRPLDAPNPCYNPVVAEIAARHLAAELAELRREGELAPRVARLLQHAMKPSAVSVGCDAALQERICSELGMIHGALRRELAREGTSLQALCAEVKLEEARRLLEESRLSMTEIGHRLGFIRQSAFTHFFQRNIGISPLRYRQARRSWA